MQMRCCSLPSCEGVDIRVRDPRFCRATFNLAQKKKPPTPLGLIVPEAAPIDPSFPLSLIQGRDLAETVTHLESESGASIDPMGASIIPDTTGSPSIDLTTGSHIADPYHFIGYMLRVHSGYTPGSAYQSGVNAKSG